MFLYILDFTTFDNCYFLRKNSMHKHSIWIYIICAWSIFKRVTLFLPAKTFQKHIRFSSTIMFWKNTLLIPAKSLCVDVQHFSINKIFNWFTQIVCKITVIAFYKVFPLNILNKRHNLNVQKASRLRNSVHVSLYFLHKLKERELYWSAMNLQT